MKFYNLLSAKKSAVLERWYSAILDTYPSDTSGFLKSQKNPFLNPVGSTIFQGIDNLYNELLNESGGDRVTQFLDNIVRIRAVQDFTPSQGVIFILLLKKAIREEIKEELAAQNLYSDLLEFELKIDDMSLLAFDIFMKCREKIYQLKANELQKWTFRRLKKADEMDKQECVHEDIYSEITEFQRKEVTK
jgi:uncharacterized membrane protein YheB (UPF0754 family)